jgi:AraC family transcriptional regulator of adaptative response/methylated-DNA-[protein]-cysteine methyltransferase
MKCIGDRTQIEPELDTRRHFAKKFMADYDRIAEAIAFITHRVQLQPSLEDIARHVNLSPFHCQRLFSRWAGITPKRFLEVLTLEHAKLLLKEPRPLLDVSETLGLSSGSRLHDHFVHLEAVTPGQYKSGGEGVTIEYGVHDTPFGPAFMALTAKGISELAFLDQDDAGVQIDELRARWPRAEIRQNQAQARSMLQTLFNHVQNDDRPLSLHVSGTNFQTRVWRALLKIPPGTVVTYSEIATSIGRPRSARAVGSAIAVNPVAFLIPCHRVIRRDGDIGGYRWGETRKRAMLAWESTRLGSHRFI